MDATMTTIPWLDLTRQCQQLKDHVGAVFGEVLAKGSFILGPFVESFENDFARYVGSRYCVGLNSGTSALQLALLACAVGPGDEVITVPASWISTCWAISYVGARPVFVDIAPQTRGMDPNLVERAISARTRAILPVHLYGQPVDIAALEKIADRHGLALIEDACQAHGAFWNGRHMGTFGRAGCFSFYPGKNLGAFGEAGALVTDDGDLAARVRRLRDHAQSSRHVHDEIGFNMRMEGIQGAVLGVKLPHLPRWSEARRRICRRYSAAWNGLPGLQVPVDQPGYLPGCHIYGLRCPDRKSLQDYLAARNIQTTIHYPTSIHLQPAYRDLGYRAGDFPEAEALFREVVTMPLFPEMRDDEVERVVAAVRDWALAHGQAGQHAA
jgi:dTDP-4-amino-4,6-dideoxygalactose transaminase